MFEDNLYEDALNDDTNLLNQSIHEDGEENQDIGGDEEGTAGATAQPIEVKIRKKRNIIRPIDRFMGERGLQSVEEYFKGARYKGKGRESEDINTIMNGLQHWAHRAFPKMKFDDSLTIIEGLTKKRIVMTHMTKYRLDMLQPVPISTEEEPREADDADLATPMDDFDDLLGDQIEQMTRVQKQKAHSTALHNTSTFSDLNASVDVSLGCAALPSTPARKPTTLSSEQMAKIAENRLKALERLKQKQAEAAAAENPNPSANETIEEQQEEELDEPISIE